MKTKVMSHSEQMYKIVEDYQNSGKTQKEYSQVVGIGKSKLNYWVRKWQARQTQPANGFMKIETCSAVEESIEITYPNGVKLKAVKADLSFISQLIRLY
jgi:transposase-like protein